MAFRPGSIDGVVWVRLRRHADDRGWLCELFRDDEVPEPYRPVMAYVSQTEPGIARGPHEHEEQADYFCFLGPSNFRLYLWDNRLDSLTYHTFETVVVGADNPTAVIIPPGVVHAYKNVGAVPGVVFNCPNQLYRGPGKQLPVDEIRHEDQPDSPYQLDEIVHPTRQAG